MIGLINLSHSDPLAATFNDNEIERHSASENFDLVLNKKVDIAMIPLVSYLKNKDKLNLVKSMNIHSVSNTVSTVLVSKYKYLKDNARIAVTSLTKTTELYLKLIMDKIGIKYELCHSKYNDYKNLLNDYDYALVIGDNAIMSYNNNVNIIMDTGLEFSKLYNMEPVYAVTAGYNHSSLDLENTLNEHILQSKKYVNEFILKNAEKFNVKKELMSMYYRSIDYSYNYSVEKTINFLDKIIENNIQI